MEGNEMFFECKASKVRIVSEEPIPWTVDGEFGGKWTEINIRNNKQAVGMFLDTTEEIEGLEAGDKSDSTVDENEIAATDNQYDLIYDADVEDDYFDSWD